MCVSVCGCLFACVCYPYPNNRKFVVFSINTSTACVRAREKEVDRRGELKFAAFEYHKMHTNTYANAQTHVHTCMCMFCIFAQILFIHLLLWCQTHMQIAICIRLLNIINIMISHTHTQTHIICKQKQKQKSTSCWWHLRRTRALLAAFCSSSPSPPVSAVNQQNKTATKWEPQQLKHRQPTTDENRRLCKAQLQQ